MAERSTPTVAAAGTLAIGEDQKTLVNRLGFGSMQLPGPGVWGDNVGASSPNLSDKEEISAQAG